MTTAAHVLMGIAGVLLFVAGLIAVSRIAHGPSQLDRSAAADLTVAVVIDELARQKESVERQRALRAAMAETEKRSLEEQREYLTGRGWSGREATHDVEEQA